MLDAVKTSEGLLLRGRIGSDCFVGKYIKWVEVELRVKVVEKNEIWRAGALFPEVSILAPPYLLLTVIHLTTSAVD